MTRRLKVALWGSPQKFAILDLDDMNGATLGTNLFYQGKLLDPRDVLNQFARGSTTVVAGGGSGGPRPPITPGGDLTTDEVVEGRYNLYFTSERAQDAVGGILTDSADVDFTYDDDAPSITAVLKPTGVAAGTYGDATHVARITCDVNGRILDIEEVEITGGGGGGTWGSITGTLSDQTDLQAALDDKADRDANQTFRTRSANTGGGDIYTRNLWHGPVSYQWWADASGDRIFGSGPDGDPATYWSFFLGTGPDGFGTDPIAIDLTTGEVNTPFLTTTTQAPGDNSTNAATTAYVDDAVASTFVHAPGCVFENGGAVLSGTLTSEIQIPYAATITAWTIAGDVAGSASIVVSHSTYAAYDTMTTLFTATCTTSKKAQATGLSYALSAGDILRFSGSGFAAFTRCSIVLEAA